jgi:hypothetical protein
MNSLPPEKGILPLRMGGLGNQLFIVAAGYATSKATGLPLYLPVLDKDRNKHNTRNLNYNETIFKHLGIQLDATESTILYQSHGQNYKPHTFNRSSAFAAWHPFTVQPGTIMDSYYQFYPTLEPYEEELRETMLKGLKSIREELKTQFEVCGAAFLHIRRGDYVGLSHIHYIQPLSYYQTALEALQNSVERILIFSDDVEWVKQQDLFRKNPKIQFVPADLDEIQSLTLMSLCTEGAICANSTFSWWGAFLGAHAKRSPIYVPSRWISDPPIVSLFPESWTILQT